MPIVTTQVTRDYLRLDGHNVPLSTRAIESIIGTDPRQFTNELMTTTTTTAEETDDDITTIIH